MSAFTPEQEIRIREIAVEVAAAAFAVAADLASRPLRLDPHWIAAEVSARALSEEMSDA